MGPNLTSGVIVGMKDETNTTLTVANGLRVDKKIDTVFDDQMKLLMVTELFEDWIQNEIQDMVNKLQNWHNY